MGREGQKEGERKKMVTSSRGHPDIIRSGGGDMALSQHTARGGWLGVTSSDTLGVDPSWSNDCDSNGTGLWERDGGGGAG